MKKTAKKKTAEKSSKPEKIFAEESLSRLKKFPERKARIMTIRPKS